MKHLDKIEAYLNQEYTAEQRLIFEKECTENPELAAELAFYLQTKTVFYSNKKAALNERYHQAKTKKQPSFFEQIQAQIALFFQNVFVVKDFQAQLSFGVVLLLVGFSIWQILPNNQVLPQTFPALAQQQEVDLFLISETTMSDDTSLNIIKQAIEIGVQKDYSKAIELVDTFSMSASNYFKALEIKGLYHYQLGNYESSIEAFEAYTQQLDGQYKMQAHWYKALAYLQLNQPAKARKQLGIIINTNHHLKQQAETLFNNMTEIPPIKRK